MINLDILNLMKKQNIDVDNIINEEISNLLLINIEINFAISLYLYLNRTLWDYQ